MYQPLSYSVGTEQESEMFVFVFTQICSFKAPGCRDLAAKARELARTLPVCLLDRHFPETLPFGQAKVSVKNFQF